MLDWKESVLSEVPIINLKLQRYSKEKLTGKGTGAVYVYPLSGIDVGEVAVWE